MALTSTGVWEVRASGHDLNAGYFNPARNGFDYSVQDAAALSLIDVVTNGTTTLTSATGGFTADMVGNGVSIAGTIYEIVSYTNGNTVIIDRSAVAATGQSARVGGALATPGKAAGVVASGNRIWIKKDPSPFMVSATANVSGGRVSLAAVSLVTVQGYDIERGDGGLAALAPAVNNLMVFNVSAPSFNGNRIVNVAVENPLGCTGVTGINNSGGYGFARNVTVDLVVRSGTGISGVNNLVSASVRRCATGITCGTMQTTVFCVAYENTIGFSISNAGSSHIFPIAHHNTGDGFRCNGGASIEGLISANNGGHGLLYTGGNQEHGAGLFGSLLVGNGGYGLKDMLVNWGVLGDVAYFGNTLGNKSSNISSIGAQVTLSANPFVDAANADYRLTSAATAELYAAGMGFSSKWLTSFRMGRSIQL